ncbi:MAG: hypothetical protein OXD50_10485 [Chloroflexi bacterium]|nr:hypothetical protein [Chloroflexota bacterium]
MTGIASRIPMDSERSGFLELSFKDLEQETKAFAANAAKFFESTHQLFAVAGALRQIARTPNRSPQVLQITREDPLRTIPTKGFRRRSGSRQTVQAEVSTTWDITPLEEVGPKRRFSVQNASTTATVFDLSREDSPRLVYEWRMEIAAGDPPGCFFHAQLGEPLKQWLEVPRLPFIVATPAACAEFVLGELFQDEWPRHVDRKSNGGSGTQRRYLLQWLEWQYKAVNASSGSPWLGLKAALPQPDSFI